MRNAFAQEITELVTENEDIVLLSGDIGNRLFDNYKKAAPDRFFNCGVAEANMTGMAAGLAKSGLRPVTYTIAPFATVRCLEQIKIDICYHNLPVVIVGTGAGLSYAALGPTHHSCEDIGMLRLLPNMSVVCPCDPIEVKLALRQALHSDGPVYIRLGKKGEPSVHKEEPEFVIGKSITLKNGEKLCLLSSGNTISMALSLAEKFEKSGVSTRVESVHTVKPIDQDLLKDVMSSFAVVSTIEEHSLIGGLGSAVAEWKVDNDVNTPVLRFGTSDSFLSTVGSQQYARESLGLAEERMFQSISERLQRL